MASALGFKTRMDLLALLRMCNGILRFTAGVTTADSLSIIIKSSENSTIVFPFERELTYEVFACTKVQKVQKNSSAYGGVRVYPPPHGIPTTQPAFIE